MADHNFTIVSVAVQESTEGLDAFLETITFPVLHDREHVLTELFAISNVPTVVWIDEHDRIVRPNAVMFGTDTFKDFTGVESEADKDLVRAWVTEGKIAGAGGVDANADVVGEGVVGEGVVGELDDDEVLARLHFRIGAHLLREGDEEGGREHLLRAGELAPHDFTIRRAAMPLLGIDPFGDAFFELFGEWQAGGSKYHGIGISR